MLTRNFAFFSSMLGAVLLNSAGGGFLLVTTPALIALIWLVSGFRYAVYGFVIWIAFITPSLIQTSLFFAATLPKVLPALEQIIPVPGGNPNSLPLAIAILYNAPTIYLWTVGQAFLSCWGAQTLGKKVLKQIAVIKKR